MQDRFHDEDAAEWTRMKSEVKNMAKVCRTFQLKLKKAQEKSDKLKEENAKLARTVGKDLRRRHQSRHQPPSPQLPPPQQQGSEMWKSAVIWGAVLVAGFQFLKFKVNS